jgi:hypothetical protein
MVSFAISLYEWYLQWQLELIVNHQLLDTAKRLLDRRKIERSF